MAIVNEINRIKDDRDRIRAKMITLGVAEASDKLDALTSKIEDITDNGAVSGTIDGIETTSVTIPEGFTSGGTVSLTDAIERALQEV